MAVWQPSVDHGGPFSVGQVSEHLWLFFRCVDLKSPLSSCDGHIQAAFFDMGF